MAQGQRRGGRRPAPGGPSSENSTLNKSVAALRDRGSQSRFVVQTNGCPWCSRPRSVWRMGERPIRLTQCYVAGQLPRVPVVGHGFVMNRLRGEPPATIVAGTQSNFHIQLMATQKRSPRRPRGSGKLPATPGFRSPIRISIDHEALAAIDKRALAAQIGIGVVAGWLASWLVGGTGLLRYVLTGLVGSFVGGALLEHLGVDLGLRSQTANRIATATLGAVVVVLLARLVS